MYNISESPEQRFPVGRPITSDEGYWVIVHLKSRREKLFAKELKKQKIGYYMPQYEKKTRRPDTGKIRKSIIPLFPGYMAVVFEPQNENIILSNPNLAGVIKVRDQKKIMFELMQIQRILGENVEFEIANHLEFGTTVKVLHGPFEGVRGVVIKKDGETRLAVSVEMLGQAIVIKIKKSLLSIVKAER